MSDLTEQEGKQLVEALNKLKIKPKFDTTEDLESWLKAYGAEPEVKVEPGTASAKATSVTSTYQPQPRISLFYGDNVKGEATYAQWKYEVKCLLLEKTHKPEALAQAIRRSLRGEASNLVRRLGIGATIPEILDKFESVYGAVDTKENLLAKFYSAKQEENEDVTKWSCRLEDILSSAVERRLVDPSKVNEMLHNMFWQGLKPSLKDISGYKFEQVLDFDKLRVEVRKLEQDHLHTSAAPKAESKAQCNLVTEDKKDNTEMREIKTMLQSLTSTVKQLEEKVNSTSDFQIQPNNQGQSSHYNRRSQGPRNTQYNNQNVQAPPSFNNNLGNRGKRRQRHQNIQPQNFNNSNQYFANQSRPQQDSYNNNQNNYNNSQGYSQNQGPNQNQAYNNEGDNFNRGPLCFRCRQYGHYQWQCPVSRMDHSRKHLN